MQGFGFFRFGFFDGGIGKVFPLWPFVNCDYKYQLIDRRQM